VVELGAYGGQGLGEFVQGEGAGFGFGLGVELFYEADGKAGEARRCGRLRGQREKEIAGLGGGRVHALDDTASGRCLQGQRGLGSGAKSFSSMRRRRDVGEAGSRAMRICWDLMAGKVRVVIPLARGCWVAMSVQPEEVRVWRWRFRGAWRWWRRRRRLVRRRLWRFRGGGRRRTNRWGRRWRGTSRWGSREEPEAAVDGLVGVGVGGGGGGGGDGLVELGLLVDVDGQVGSGMELDGSCGGDCVGAWPRWGEAAAVGEDLEALAAMVMGAVGVVEDREVVAVVEEAFEGEEAYGGSSPEGRRGRFRGCCRCSV